MIRFITVVIILLFTDSCVVQAPAYTTIEKVFTLKTGLSQSQVDSILGVPPYDIKSLSDTGVSVYIYKYRVTERKAVPGFVHQNNGMKTKGKYVDLFVTFSADGKMLSMVSCSECSETKEKREKLNINTVIMFLTITVPALFVYLGLTTP